jgi:hypothetical protein
MGGAVSPHRQISAEALGKLHAILKIGATTAEIAFWNNAAPHPGVRKIPRRFEDSLVAS